MLAYDVVKEIYQTLGVADSDDLIRLSANQHSRSSLMEAQKRLAHEGVIIFNAQETVTRRLALNRTGRPMAVYTHFSRVKCPPEPMVEPQASARPAPPAVKVKAAGAGLPKLLNRNNLTSALSSRLGLELAWYAVVAVTEDGVAEAVTPSESAAA